MYVSINCDDMTFMHAHDHLHVVDALMYLEGSQISSIVANPNHPNFCSSLTVSEMQLLYKNTTGEVLMVTGTRAMRAAIRGVALALPCMEVNFDELDVQTSKVKENDSENSYRYVPGSRTPAKMASLWKRPALRVLTVPAPVDIAPTVVTTLAPAQPSTSGPRAPRKGGTSKRVNEYAQAAWEAAGKPTDIATLLQLRKGWMDELEKEGHRRTSVSSALGQWQKKVLG